MSHNCIREKLISEGSNTAICTQSQKLNMFFSLFNKIAFSFNTGLATTSSPPGLFHVDHYDHNDSLRQVFSTLWPSVEQVLGTVRRRVCKSLALCGVGWSSPWHYAGVGWSSPWHCAASVDQVLCTVRASVCQVLSILEPLVGVAFISQNDDL